MLRGSINKVIRKSGFKGKNPDEDTFIAGHSMGSACANFVTISTDYSTPGSWLSAATWT